MPGAGGALAANYIAHAAPSDGFTIGLLAEVNAPALATGNLLNDVHFLGSPAATVPVMVFSKRSGIATLDDWRRRPVPPRIASSGPRAVTDVVPRVVAATLSLPATMVTGYTGTSEIRHAMENGEVDGVCLTLDSVRPLFGSPSAVDQVLQFSRSPQDNPDIPDALSLATQESATRSSRPASMRWRLLVRFLAAPKGVRADLVALLRAGLLQTWSDAAFLEAANEIGIEIKPVTADRLEQTVRHLAADKSVVAELRSILDVR